MIGFGLFTPFSFLFPLIFLLLIGRAVARLGRRYGRRRFLDDDFYDSDRVGTDSVLRVPAAGPHASAPGSDFEPRIFKLAYRLKGRITASDIVVELGVGVAEAERIAQSLVDGSHVVMEVDDRGIITYEFPEIIGRFEE